jgi:hypothetical protein
LSRRKQQAKKHAIQARQRTSAPPDDSWDSIFWMPEPNVVPARDWLFTVPKPVRIMMVAILDSVRDGPPPAFPPSQYWHAMHGLMSGLYEARDAHDGMLYRLFCVLDRKAPEHGLPRPAIAILCGGIKPEDQAMEHDVYGEALAAKDRYAASSPRAYLPPPGIPPPVRYTA